AGDRGFVDGALAAEDDAVGGDAVAGADEDGGIDGEAFGWDFARGLAALEQRRLGDEVREALDAGAGAAGGDAFEQFADEEEDDDHRSLLARADDDGADGGDGHQRFDGEGGAVEGTDDGAVGNRQQADQHGRGEDPVAQGRDEPRD